MSTITKQDGTYSFSYTRMIFWIRSVLPLKRKKSYFLVLFLLWEFFTLALAGDFHLESQWYNRSPQVSSILLSILAHLNNPVVRIFMILSLISNLFSPISKPFWIVLSARTTIGNIVTLMFLCFLVLWQGLSIR